MPEYHLDLWTWLNSVQMRMPTGSRWMSNNYINRHHSLIEFETVPVAVSSSSVPVTVGDRMPAEWEPAPDRGLEPPATHGWAAQPRWGRSTAMVPRRTFGQYVAVCTRLQFTSHTQQTSPFRIKCERYIFIKKCGRSFIEVRILCWLCFRILCIYICMRLYNTIFLYVLVCGAYITWLKQFKPWWYLLWLVVSW